MAFRRNWITAQQQATNCLKRYYETDDEDDRQRDKLMRMAQAFIAEAIKLDPRYDLTGPIDPED